jgi:hypothetical protein
MDPLQDVLQLRAEVRDALPPVERVVVDVVSRGFEPELELEVRELDHAQRLEAGASGQREPHQVAQRDVDRVDPVDVVEDPDRALLPELGPHDPGEHQDLRPAADGARRGIAGELPERLVFLGAEVILEEAAVLVGLQRPLDLGVLQLERGLAGGDAPRLAGGRGGGAASA